ncbi:hypothetical protein [Mucilaginibacter terrae]|uniref:Uncharacterized protein n=1 Tax=Mucilaginibacter terrae TaxID=1955052 RepID=A0ABU3GR95_9SPHI|nr:hypothetical protein [Mucilaginibacter terrae]MDT3402302.1 hypothetical protein [Mucilaginibacter terrae]
MHKNILGIAAVIIAISASAFTTPAHHGKLVSYKWFRITANRTTSQSVPSSGATYLGESETPPQPDGFTCSGSTNQCISGFNASQVNSSNQLDGTQMPQTIAATRN